MSKVRPPSPSFTYTKTFARWPELATTASAVFVPLQAGSWLISIFAAGGAVPSNFTAPLTLAAVAGSIGVAAVAAAGAAVGCSAVSSFLPQPASRISPHIAGRLRIFIQVFVFIFSLSLLRIEISQKSIFRLRDRRHSPGISNGWLHSSGPLRQRRGAALRA